MKILHVITTLDVGGAEMHLLSQVRGQSGAGHEVRMLYLKGEGCLGDDFRAAGAADVIHAPLGFGGLRRLWRELRRADIVHSHLLKADMLTAPLATLAGKRGRLISGKHNDESMLKKPHVQAVHALLGNLPSRTIVLSDHVGRYFRRYGHVRERGIRRIYYGIDPTPFEEAASMGAEERAEVRATLGLGAGDVVFICVARFAAQKAHDVLMKAFDEACRRRADGEPPLQLLLVGGDPFGDGKERAEALATTLEHRGRIHFLGIRRDVPRLLAASDSFVMSSLWEGLGLVFLESMAAGVPVLATRVSAVPEVVIDGETGLLVPPADVEGLARGFQDMAADPGRRRTLGERGRERVREDFGLERMVAETLAVYAELAR